MHTITDLHLTQKLINFICYVLDKDNDDGRDELLARLEALREQEAAITAELFG